MNETSERAQETGAAPATPWYIALGLFFFLVIPALVISHWICVAG